MYKLIAIDLDGTLLDSYGNTSTENINAIKEAKEKGVDVVLASGRPVMSVKSIASEIEMDYYIICRNGAITYDLKKKEVIYNKKKKKDKVLKVIDICEENSIYYCIYTEDMIITKSLNYNVLFFNKENAKKDPSKRVKINIVQNVREYIENSNNQKYLKFTICDSNKIIFTSINKKLKQLKNIEVLEVSHISRKMIKSGTDEVVLEYYYTEITNENVDKWYAIEDLINKLNIKKEEVITIGDNYNDLKMLENAGIGIVMQGAAEYIKEKANYVTDSNDNSGVSKAIKKFV